MPEKDLGVKIGVVGSGFIARGITSELERDSTLAPHRVLTRRDRAVVASELKVSESLITNDVEDLRLCDLVVACTGDPIYATGVLDFALREGKKVVTMDAETQITTGHYLTSRGYITEAEGDQPGSLAALGHDAQQMGFEVLVYGNMKGYLNHDPKPDDMKYWSNKNGISLQQTTSFTDGTKVQIEQTLIANGLNGNILVTGLLGLTCDDLKAGAEELANKAVKAGIVACDYLLSSKLPAGVFVVGKHTTNQQDALRYLKMGDGPYYVLTRPYHLCHLEVCKTIRRVLNGGEILINNGLNPKISVATISKRDMVPGERIIRTIGSFDARGIAIKITEFPNHIPIGLVANATVSRKIERGQMLEWDDLELPDSLALRVWKEKFLKTS